MSGWLIFPAMLAAAAAFMALLLWTFIFWPERIRRRALDAAFEEAVRIIRHRRMNEFLKIEKEEDAVKISWPEGEEILEQRIYFLGFGIFSDPSWNFEAETTACRNFLLGFLAGYIPPLPCSCGATKRRHCDWSWHRQRGEFPPIGMN